MAEKITEKLISLFRLNRGDRVKNYGYFESLSSIAFNLLLFFVKFFFGRLLNSVALLADSFHTLSDLFTSLLVLFGFKFAAKPPDERHPFGHGRAEPIFAILIAFLLIGAGIEFLLISFRRLLHPRPIEVNLLIIIILLLSIAIKEFLTLVSKKLGEKINSISLKGDAWHHRTDSIATAFLLLGFLLYRFGFFRLDGILGIAISGLIILIGSKLIFESSNILIGSVPEESFIKKIRETAQGVSGVKDAHDIQVHTYGKRMVVTIHICLKDDTHLDDAHKKADEVERAIREAIEGADVTVHLEPEREAVR